MYFSNRKELTKANKRKPQGMGNGLDVCMADPREAQTIEECLESEFVRTLVCQAGLVISVHKPVAVFGFTPRAWRGGDHRQKRALSARLLATYASSTRRYGLCLAGLSRHAEGLMLLAWRPLQVEKIVADAQSRAFLDSVGLPSGDASALMAELVGRLRAYYAGRASFPHELGLVLGYPVDDVRGFMADGGRGAKVVGRWRCCGNVENARRRFDELARRERECRLSYAQGTSVRELLEMGAA